MSDEAPNRKGLTKGRLPKFPLAVANLNGPGVPLTASKWGTTDSPPTVVLGAIRVTIDDLTVRVTITGTANDQSILSVRNDEAPMFLSSRTDVSIGLRNSIDTFHVYPLSTDTNFTYEIVVVSGLSAGGVIPLFLKVTAIGSF